MTELTLTVWALIAAGWDLRLRRLPNILTLGGLAFGLVILFMDDLTFLGASRDAAWEALGVSVLLTLPAYACRLLGAGDVKLAAAIAVLTGLTTFLTVYTAATFLTLAVLVLLRYINCIPYGNLPCLDAMQGPAGSVTRGGGRTIPFGASLGAALALVMLGQLAGFHV